MKTNIFRFAFFLFATSLLFTACFRDECSRTITYDRYDPVYLSLADLRSSVKVEPPKDLKDPGKIYVYNQYLFVNEIHEGIHIIDNTNPAAPINKAFITIPGNVDLAVNGSILYADSYIDLVVIDISDLNNLKEVKRIQNAFPKNHAYKNITAYYANIEPAKGIVIDWQKVRATEKGDCLNYGYYYYEAFSSSVGTSNSGGNPTNSTSGGGKGGSMARFALAAQHLYTVSESSLIYYNLAQADNPLRQDSLFIGQNIETIFPYQQNLFIGSQSGMFIYSIQIK